MKRSDILVDDGLGTQYGPPPIPFPPWYVWVIILIIVIVLYFIYG